MGEKDMGGEGKKWDKILKFLEKIEEIKKKIEKEIINYFEKKTGMPGNEILKILKNYEEKVTSIYDLKDAISWAKSRLPADKIVYVVIYKRTTDLGRYKLYHFFIDENKEILDDYPWRVVVANELGENLKNLFKDKELIMLK